MIEMDYTFAMLFEFIEKFMFIIVVVVGDEYDLFIDYICFCDFRLFMNRFV